MEWLFPSLGVLAAIGLATYALWRFQHARTLADTPTSLIRSAPQGRVELQGVAKLIPGPKIHAPLTHKPCVWWRFSVWERVRDRKNRTSWRRVAAETSDDLFLLADTTGECVVDPHGARVVGAHKKTWYGNSYPPDRGPNNSAWAVFAKFRYIEEHIPLISPLHGSGFFRSQNAYQEFDEQTAVTSLLAEWKRDQASLLREHDTNDDGAIDLEEWEQVRRKAARIVRGQLAEQAATPDLHVLCEPPRSSRLPARRRYTLSAMDEDKLIRNDYVSAAVSAIASIGIGAVALIHLSRLL